MKNDNNFWMENLKPEEKGINKFTIDVFS